MTEQEYKEPTNNQLAHFLVIYAQQIPQLQHLKVNAEMLESQLSDPGLREIALQHHRAFQDQVRKIAKRVMAGELQCEHIRPNGRRCPNHNEPGSFYCGLHPGEENEESHGGTAVA